MELDLFPNSDRIAHRYRPPLLIHAHHTPDKVVPASKIFTIRVNCAANKQAVLEQCQISRGQVIDNMLNHGQGSLPVELIYDVFFPGGNRKRITNRSATLRDDDIGLKFACQGNTYRPLVG